MGKLKRIYNQTAVSQSIAWKGLQLTIKPYEEMQLDEDVARAFLERCEGFVINAPDGYARVESVVAQRETVWLANMTGNPDAPEEIELRVWKDRQWQWAKQPNPIKNPLFLRERHGIEQKEYVAKDGVLEALNKPGATISIPPYTRLEFDAPIARWFLARSMQSSPQSRLGTFPKVIVSRPPTRDEPDITWPLDTLLAYLKFIDPDCKFGRDEAAVRRSVPKAKRDKPGEVEAALEDEKRHVLKRIYFRVVDPQYRIPSAEEFAEFMAGPGSAQAEDVPPEDAALEAALTPDA